MNQTTYGITKATELDFNSAVEKTKEALKAEGFGVLTTIDVQSKIKEKLDKNMEPYLILGACNPSSAYQVLQEETEIGLLLPCNVIVYAKEGQVHVSAIRPMQAMDMIDNANVKKVAEEIEEKLTKAIKSI